MPDEPVDYTKMSEAELQAALHSANARREVALAEALAITKALDAMRTRARAAHDVATATASIGVPGIARPGVAGAVVG